MQAQDHSRCSPACPDSGCSWDGGLRVIRLLTFWLKTSRVNALVTALEVTALLLSQVCPMSKEKDMEITSQWEECQSPFIRRSHGMGNIVLPIFGKHNCDGRFGFYLSSFQGVSLEGSRPHVSGFFLLTVTIFMLRILPPNETSSLALLLDMWSCVLPHVQRV